MHLIVNIVQTLYNLSFSLYCDVVLSNINRLLRLVSNLEVLYS
jgi:hypothetical protein